MSPYFLPNPCWIHRQSQVRRPLRAWAEQIAIQLILTSPCARTQLYYWSRSKYEFEIFAAWE